MKKKGNQKFLENNTYRRKCYELYQNIKNELIKNEVYKRVKDYSKNRNDLETYYKVGKLLVEAQGGEENFNYGNQLIKEYSKKLTSELGKGYSIRNLYNMRLFYIRFKNLQPLAANLTWTNLTLLLPIKDETKRNYYINLCIRENLSKRELITRIKNKEYERLGFIDKENIKIDNETNNVTELIKNPILIKNNKNEKIFTTTYQLIGG